MNNKGTGWLALGAAIAAVGAVAPVVVRAPEPALSLPRDVRTLDEALDDCLGSGLDGWELVDHATRLVNQKFSRFSLWHLWESSGLAFQHSRGFSEQYNLALARVLAALGFEVQAVHAGRVEFDTERPGKNAPSRAAGHTWLRVTAEGETRDVCASRGDHTAGHLRFTPVTPVQPLRPWTGFGIRLALAGPVIKQVWQSWLTGSQVPRWLHRGFHDQG